MQLANDGGVYIGDFENDEMHGNGCFTMPDGGEYIGEFRNGIQHGDGMLTTSKGTEIYGRWVDGDYQSLSYNIELEGGEET